MDKLNRGRIEEARAYASRICETVLITLRTLGNHLHNMVIPRLHLLSN